jgi:hypothetical protein
MNFKIKINPNERKKLLKKDDEDEEKETFLFS